MDVVCYFAQRWNKRISLHCVTNHRVIITAASAAKSLLLNVMLSRSPELLRVNPWATELNPICTWVTLLAGKVFTHNCDTGKFSALIQCWNIVQQIERDCFQRYQT
jgi:hypothetical protein